MDALRESLPRTRGWFALIGVLVAVFLLAPLVAILPLAFTSSQYLTFPPEGFSGQWFSSLVHDPGWRGSIENSARVATAGAVIATVAGTCAALAVRRIRGGRRALRTTLLAPLVIPQLVLALGLYFTYRGLFGGTSLLVLTIGQATLAMPLVFVNVSAGLASVDPALSRAAESLGFKWPAVIRRVELPLARRSILSGLVLAFAVCFDESVLAYFIAPPGEATLPVMIWTSASQSASPSIAAASAFVICLAMTLLAVVVALRPRKTQEARPAKREMNEAGEPQ